MAKSKKQSEPVISRLQPARQTLTLHGQQKAEKALMEAFASGRMPHSWLITGAKGIGKATLAYRFARHALSEKGKDEAAIRRIILGSHTDLLTLENEVGK